ncbi:MAG TPA: glycosyltransferase family protein, partial [Candidatus Binatia bacterium]|nr:glycosyltransferase family protein [Candidatus Binatia bacterium]
MSSILYYITGHGFGHAVRSNQVIRALKKAAPWLDIHVRTTAPEWLFKNSSHPVSHTRRVLDVGIIQPNSLELDLEQTLRACRELHLGMKELVREEIAFVDHNQIDLIVGDIPPVCFEIAARAKLPSVAISNFTWDFIYTAYANAHREFLPLIDEMKGFYQKASLALTLPYPCGMRVFPNRRSIPWISRASQLTKAQARAAFRLPPAATIVLLSFGGIGLNSLPWNRFLALEDYFFVATGPTEVSQRNVLVLADAQQHYEDLLRAVDVVVTKPGYGIVADVLSHQIPILYTDRGEFPEYSRLVQALTECATADYIPQSELLAGRIAPYLERLISKQANWPKVELDGAQVASQSIL